ncbi:hypothetical protein PoB_005397500 [Plakobranchus ocellatus]|uniref:Uncharacterized protein n=1 Tax=Plakobranchus ocellatus TaxID=259542 RepID=A0AAV4C702_9GAST|nr:hypothetical protein PoB_005397500 [Plakobranchus ocellatus]
MSVPDWAPEEKVETMIPNTELKIDGRNNLRWLSLQALVIVCPAGGGHNSGFGVNKLQLGTSRCTKSSDEFNVACIELGGHLPIKGNFESVNMACAELAGHENVKEEEGYHRFTEEDVDAIVDAANLSVEDYNQIKREVTRMGLESTAACNGAGKTQVL